MKLIRIGLFGILGLLILLAILLTAVTIHHHRQLKKETKLYLPAKTTVNVNGTDLHVAIKGNGDYTLVFMSGHGTNNPALDFKPLWSELSNDYRIAIVEKAGYGWSDTSNISRDIGTLLEETREALKLSGEDGPYILVPHSMAGLEAIYWAQQFPNEVLAIIGLDPSVPASYDILPEPNTFQLDLMYLISRTGISRFMGESEVANFFPLLKLDYLTEEEKNEYVAAFYKNAYSRNVINEVKFVKDNAKLIAKGEIPSNIPMLFFISSGQESIAAGWKDKITAFLADITMGKYSLLSTGHYIHYQKSYSIADEMNRFLENLGL